MESWLKCLKEDSRAIFRASSLATKAVDYLNDLQPTEMRKAA
jgi:antirestriction protein ArdC